jgi:hypothetical protein
VRELLTRALHGIVILTALFPAQLSRAQMDASAPLLTLSVGQAGMDIPRSAVAAMEISESGGITDIFLRLLPAAAADMAELTGNSIGERMEVRACGSVMMEAVVRDRIGSGTIYLDGTTAVRAEALRALWHGRASCDTLDPEVFEHGK